ncbi:rhamnogalacturonan acetylesterase [Calycomorphotria hydatis]|uniref:Rhamnogalacturonan acetylesterase RhgT n=1 Tax=Calycomorphotria hydatis TaxID=2528027 RepID=A0A517TDC9_9PLAN|nr:rhamnogalacturonan acetylesterase [Calycomorphotria hydatis]QDT66386.1 Rhamnogalacturonan acetylesterase RhgT [Calycomorphotria hydatis]
MKFSIGMFVLLCLPAFTWADEQEQKTITIALIGDSTVTDKVGWGKAFAGRFDDTVTVRNFAKGGRSSKSWVAEGRLPAVLEAKPDYVFIQFGHNGQPGKGPERETDPETTYRDFLKMYVEEFRKIGAKPIIVSSVTRRKFNDSGIIASTLTPWAEAAGEVAKELSVPFIDLHTVSVAYHNAVGVEASMTFNPKEGDVSHFNEKGAEVITDLIIKQMVIVVPELSEHLKVPAAH